MYAVRISNSCDSLKQKCGRCVSNVVSDNLEENASGFFTFYFFKNKLNDEFANEFLKFIVIIKYEKLKVDYSRLL